MEVRRGFTLIEILLVISLLAILVVAGNRLFFSALKGSSKAERLALVKQNGQYALSVMERMIRNARALESCTATELQIDNPDLLAKPEERWTKFVFDATNHYIASESSALSGAASRLTDPRVSLASGSFSCILGADGVPDQVTISFTLQQAAETSQPEETASADFQTTVVLRNVD